MSKSTSTKNTIVDAMVAASPDPAALRAAVDEIEATPDSKKPLERGDVDLTKIDELDQQTLYTFAKLDHADVKAARAAKSKLPATPFVDELTRRNEVRNSTKAQKKTGGGGGVRIDDAELTKLVVTAMRKGVNTPQRVVNAIRAAGGSSSLKRVRAIFEQKMKGDSELSKIVSDSLKASPAKTSKPAAKKPAVTQTSPASALDTSDKKPAKATNATKKSPGQKQREAAAAKTTRKVTPIPKTGTTKRTAATARAGRNAARKSA